VDVCTDSAFGGNVGGACVFILEGTLRVEGER
jgi:hypothetical protein